MKRLGLGLLGEPGVHAMMDLARHAEDLGYESIWLTETRYTRDAITTAAAVALATKRAKVATGVVNAFTRGAVLTAVTFATLDELAHGRVLLGIGPGSPLVLEKQGIGFDQPLRRLKEYVDVTRMLLAGDTVTYEGETVCVRDVKLDFTPPRSRIPIYLGVTGPRALGLAGEISDGIMLNGFVSADYIRRAVKRVEMGAARSGRSASDIDLTGVVIVSADLDSQRAKDAARPLVGIYLSTFPNIARESSFSEAELAPIRAAMAAGGPEAAARQVSDEMVDELTCSGTPAECRARIEERRDAGLAVPIIFPIFGDVPMILTEMAQA